MTNAIESWSWNGCEGKKTNVEVYARAAAVELFVNGVSQGTKKSRRDCKFEFRVEYQPGEITGVAFDASGDEISRTSITSAGEETVLSLEPERDTVGNDELGYVWIRYTDSNRTLKPLARGIVKTSVCGGRLLGLGSASPYNPDGYLNDYTDTYYGMALAVVKPDGPGEMVINAESPPGSAAVSIRCGLPSNEVDSRCR
jgi:beta-galactosidase